MSKIKSIGGLLLVALFLFPAAGLAQYDANGNNIGGSETPDMVPGDPCGSCPDPGLSIFGLTFKDGDLWALDSSSGMLYHLSSCSVVGTLPTGLHYSAGLGYDHVRGVFIVTDASADVVHQINMAGTVVRTYPAPGSGPVGAAYDPTRDLYWISDWERDDIAALDPNTGLVVHRFPVPEGSRIAGAGYDEGQDAILYNGRDEVWTYWMSAATGALTAKFPNPGGAGNDNGNGTAIAPDGNGWVSHREQNAMFCIGGFTVATESASWGSIKALHR